MGNLIYQAGVKFDADRLKQGEHLQGFVQIDCDGDRIGQLDPGEAIKSGLALIASGIEAERDAGFLSWAIDELEVELPVAGQMLAQLRRYREQWSPDNPIVPRGSRPPLPPSGIDS